MSDPRLGAVLEGRYRIHEQIAAGGMGVVYRGERVQLGRPVAVKFLHQWIADEPQVLQRFEREARAMSRLSHPTCVSVIDFGVHEGSPYLVMDFVGGRTLRELVERGPIPAARAIEIATQVLAGLSHAHSHEIVHRDIKPENILVDEAEGFGAQVRILDFGVAKLCDTKTGLTTGFAVGTPSYMSPEQTVGDPVDARTDVYATGIVLHEMLTGRKPFVAEQASDVLKMHREAPPPRVGGSCSPELERVLTRALAKRPDDRFPSARQFAEALASTPEAGRAPRRRVAVRGPVILAPIALGVGVVALVIWAALQPDDEPAGSAPAAELVPEIEIEAEPAAPTPTPEEIPGIDEARALIDAGSWKAAVDSLRKLRKRHPESAYVPYLLGNLYLEKLWAEDGFEAYRAAIRKNPAYRRDPIVIKNAIRTFWSDNNAARGIAFLRDEIGEPAIPYLEQTTRHKNPTLRRRAEQALQQIAR